jgi:hypothetical protein
MSVDELLDGKKRAPTLADGALAQRPELVTQSAFWSRDSVPVDSAFAAIANAEELRSSGITAIIAAGRHDLAARAVREFGSLNVLEVLGSRFDIADRQSVGPWLTAAASEPATIAQFLASGQTHSWAMLSTIAHLMSPDTVPNDYGVDPWLIAVQAANKSTTDEISLFLRAYLLSRALGSRSRNPGELAQIGFEPVYIAARADRLPDDAWRILEHRLPWSFKLFDWDRCPRISAAVADLFVDRKLSTELFAQIASDERVFTTAAETVARTSRGRNFLTQVSRWMMDVDTQRYATRIRAIEDCIR